MSLGQLIRGSTFAIIAPPGSNGLTSDPGPAQLALALAADVLGDDDRAQDVYQRLKFKVVGRLPKDGWSLTEDQLRQAIADIEQEQRPDR
jgi:hypothetical protein